MSESSDPGARSRYELLFENAPVAIWLEDFSPVYEYLTELTNSRSLDLAAKFDEQPEFVAECIRRVRVIHVNRLARHFYEAETVEELSDKFPTLFDSYTLSIFREELLAFWRNETSYEADITTSTLSGEKRFVKMNCANPPDPVAPWSFVIVTFTDLTERARFEQSLKDSEQRAQSAARDLQRTNETLARLNTDLERFAYAAAHDLREPLRTISLYAQLLTQAYGGSLTGHGENALRFILEGTRRMERLIADLLSFAKLIEPSPVDAATDASAALADTLRTLDAAIREADALLFLSPLPSVALEPGHLRQLLQNLVGNALKYRHPNRRLEIRISGQRTNDHVRLTVSDNGVGIKQEYQERIFGIFQRLHGQEIHGSGIGLALCRRISGLYKGRIWVESDGVSGSIFHVEVPAPQAAAAGQATLEG